MVKLRGFEPLTPSESAPKPPSVKPIAVTLGGEGVVGFRAAWLPGAFRPCLTLH